MRNTINFFATLLLAITLFSCINSNIPNNEEIECDNSFPSNIDDQTQDNDTSTTYMEEFPTGGYYSDGRLVFDVLYYNGMHWEADSKTPESQKLPDGATYVGEVLHMDSYKEPAEEFHASYLEVGSKIYVSSAGNALYVELPGDQTVYRRYIPLDHWC